MAYFLGSNILEENATSPAVNHLTICITDCSPTFIFKSLFGKSAPQRDKAPSMGDRTTEPEEENEGENIRSGVTVRDVMSAIYSLMQESVENEKVIAILSRRVRDITATASAIARDMRLAPTLFTTREGEIVYKLGDLMVEEEIRGFQNVKKIDGRVFLTLDQRRIGEKRLNK